MDIRVEQRRGQGVEQSRLGLQEIGTQEVVDDEYRDARQRKRQGRGGEDAAGTTCVELRDRDVTIPEPLAQQQSRDEVARQDEEHVDADIAAAQERDLRVVERHQQNRERTNTLKVTPPRRRAHSLPGDRHRLVSCNAPLAFVSAIPDKHGHPTRRHDISLFHAY